MPFSQTYLTAERLSLGSQGPSEAGSPSGRRWRHLGVERERGKSGQLMGWGEQEGWQRSATSPQSLPLGLTPALSHPAPKHFLFSQPPGSHPTLLQQRSAPLRKKRRVATEKPWLQTTTLRLQTAVPRLPTTAPRLQTTTSGCKPPAQAPHPPCSTSPGAEGSAHLLSGRRCTLSPRLLK